MRLLLKEIQVLREQKVLLLLKEIQVLREHEATAIGPAVAPEGAGPATRYYRSEGDQGAEGAPAAQGDTNTLVTTRSRHGGQDQKGKQVLRAESTTRCYRSEGAQGVQGDTSAQ